MQTRLEGLIHDLNNVFTTILDTADLLESDPEYSAVAAILHRNVARGRRLMESFADTAGQPFELGPVLASAIEFARDFLQAQGTEIEFRPRLDAGLCVNGSYIAWERALFNLLINAGQAAGTRGVDITGRQTADGVEVMVIDDGPGIAAEVLPRIFEPGFSTKPVRPGLGLHIVESVVRESGGAIRAANRPDGHGAVFQISLPVAKAAEGVLP